MLGRVQLESSWALQHCNHIKVQQLDWRTVHPHTPCVCNWEVQSIETTFDVGFEQYNERMKYSKCLPLPLLEAWHDSQWPEWTKAVMRMSSSPYLSAEYNHQNAIWNLVCNVNWSNCPYICFRNSMFAWKQKKNSKYSGNCIQLM